MNISLEEFSKDLEECGFSAEEIADIFEVMAVNLEFYVGKPPPPLTKPVQLECSCGAKFSIERLLFRDATAGNREIYCPVGHEISYRGGKLERRQVTAKMLSAEFKKHTDFSFLRDTLDAINALDREPDDN